MRGGTGMRRTSRADADTAPSGTSRPEKNQYRVDVFLSTWTLLSSSMQNAWQERGAAPIAGGIFVVDGTTCAAGMGRGGLRALSALSSTMQDEWLEWDAAHFPPRCSFLSPMMQNAWQE